MKKLLLKRWQATPKCGNLPTIQILIFVDYTLRQFYKKVKGGRIEISEIIKLVDSFATCCPICHSKDCSQFLGFYYRQVIDEAGRHYSDFPVPRFLCRGKGNSVLVNHSTFSLLHYQLVPYSKYSLPFIFRVLKARHIDKETVEYIQAYIANITSSGADYMELSQAGFFSFRHLILSSINKILISGYYSDLSHRLVISWEETGIIKIFLEFCRDFVSENDSHPIRGPCGLGYDFYRRGGFYLKNAYFLFGTPSQYRRYGMK